MISRIMDIREGELVLLLTKSGPPIIGVLSGADVAKTYLVNPSYHLQKDITIDGKSHAQVTPHQTMLSSNRIHEIYEGKNEILKYLRSQAPLKNHISWISKLEKPYVFPAMSRVSFIA